MRSKQTIVFLTTCTVLVLVDWIENVYMSKLFNYSYTVSTICNMKVTWKQNKKNCVCYKMIPVTFFTQTAWQGEYTMHCRGTCMVQQMNKYLFKSKQEANTFRKIVYLWACSLVDVWEYMHKWPGCKSKTYVEVLCLAVLSFSGFSTCRCMHKHRLYASIHNMYQELLL